MTSNSELIFTESTIRKAIKSVGYLKVIDALKVAFEQFSKGLAEVAPIQHLQFHGPGTGDFCVKSGFIKNDDSMVVKVAGAGFPGYGSAGLMTVFSQHTGMLQAILVDNGWLTDLRTAAAGALCVKYFGPTSITAIGMIGTGVQARFQLDVLREVISCRRVILFGRNEAKASACVNDISEMGFKVELAPSSAYVVGMCNLVLTTTSARQPVITADADVMCGTLIVALGCDGVGKQELSSATVGQADVVIVDSRVQCLAFGETSHAVRANMLTQDKITELGTALADRSLHRQPQNDTRIIIIDLTGVAVQDVAIAKLAMHAALSNTASL